MYDYDLGRFRRPVTGNAAALEWWNRGLIWAYNFNHEEAIRCFERAVEADPTCAMAHWGIAYAAGPNYNMPWWRFDSDGRAQALARAHAAAQAAMALRDQVTPVERALIEAMQTRYPQATTIDDQSPWDHAFAESMRAVHFEFPEDAEVATVFADALLNLTPWNMWDLPTGLPGPHTQEAQTLLEAAMARPGGMEHPGLLHMYVHLMEMSPNPEKALKASDVLRTLCPDAGHLVHMPTHIDVLCGHYENVVRWNEAAVVADLKFHAREGAMNIYTGYRQHNYHFVIYGAMFLGQMDPALRALKGLRDTTPEEMLQLESPPMADFFEAYLAFEPHVLVRFGKWEEIVALTYPDDRDLYCTHVANIDYAKAVALSALGRVDEAEEQAQRFLASKARVPESRLLHNNTVVDLLEVGEAMMWGELEYRKENYDAAFAHLRRAVALEDALHYDEPWGWMQPVRHALGALLFEQGRVDEAEEVYRQDLGLGGPLPRACVHPDNIWALKGLHDCLAAKGEEAEARLIKQRLDLAQARADVTVAASCACAQAAMRCCG